MTCSGGYCSKGRSKLSLGKKFDFRDTWQLSLSLEAGRNECYGLVFHSLVHLRGNLSLNLTKCLSIVYCVLSYIQLSGVTDALLILCLMVRGSQNKAFFVCCDISQNRRIVLASCDFISVLIFYGCKLLFVCDFSPVYIIPKKMGIMILGTF